MTSLFSLRLCVMLKTMVVRPPVGQRWMGSATLQRRTVRLERLQIRTTTAVHRVSTRARSSLETQSIGNDATTPRLSCASWGSKPWRTTSPKALCFFFFPGGERWVEALHEVKPDVEGLGQLHEILDAIPSRGPARRPPLHSRPPPAESFSNLDHQALHICLPVAQEIGKASAVAGLTMRCCGRAWNGDVASSERDVLAGRREVEGDA